jgi:hypothetical protein
VARQKPKRQKRYRPRTINVVGTTSGDVLDVIDDPRTVAHLSAMTQEQRDAFLVKAIEQEIKLIRKTRPVDGDTQTRSEENG